MKFHLESRIFFIIFYCSFLLFSFNSSSLCICKPINDVKNRNNYDQLNATELMEQKAQKSRIIIKMDNEGESEKEVMKNNKDPEVTKKDGVQSDGKYVQFDTELKIKHGKEINGNKVIVTKNIINERNEDENVYDGYKYGKSKNSDYNGHSYLMSLKREGMFSSRLNPIEGLIGKIGRREMQHIVNNETVEGKKQRIITSINEKERKRQKRRGSKIPNDEMMRMKEKEMKKRIEGSREKKRDAKLMDPISFSSWHSSGNKIDAGEKNVKEKEEERVVVIEGEGKRTNCNIKDDTRRRRRSRTTLIPTKMLLLKKIQLTTSCNHSEKKKPRTRVGRVKMELKRKEFEMMTKVDNEERRNATKDTNANAQNVKKETPRQKRETLEQEGEALVADDDQDVNEDEVIFVPNNISIVLASWTPPSIRVSWTYGKQDLNKIDGSTPTSSNEKKKKGNKKNNKLEAFRIIYHPAKSRYRMIHEVPPNITVLTLDGLIPNTEYELKIVALYYLPPSASISTPTSRRDFTGNTPQTLTTSPEYEAPKDVPLESSSEPIRFISPDTEPGRFYRHSHKQLLLRKKDPNEPLKLKMDEVIIVCGVLIAWVSIIALFIKKWGKIRAIEPCQSYFSPEIYDIPLSKSLNAKRSVDMSAQTQISAANQQLILNSGLPLTGPAMASFDAGSSRRSLSALVTNLRRDSCNYNFPRSSPPSVLNEESPNAYEHHPGYQRQRVGSVFVTPPTRPVTPFNSNLNGCHGNGNGNGQQQRTSVISIRMTDMDSDSPPRRYKSAEDLRSIVNEFTRRKSTLLMSPTYFMKKD